ncbi:unnamed protein product [Polarella glacialis]|nr:unnamed protein product [Polarella glacialis]
MRIFPNAQEISESMGLLAAIDRFTDLQFGSSAVTCVCVGDGCRPRTAALACFRTKWQRIISVDPCLRMEPSYSSIARLELYTARIEDVTFHVDASHNDVVIFLPHAHVVPNIALGSLRFEAGHSPRVTVVQMPCCNYEWQDRIGGLDADHAFIDYAIGSTRRRMRVWCDVFAAAVKCGAIYTGERRIQRSGALERENGVLTTYPLSCSVKRDVRRTTEKQARVAKPSKNKFYVVLKGRQTGIFTSWDECQAQVGGFSGFQYRVFKTETEARAWQHAATTASVREEGDISVEASG